MFTLPSQNTPSNRVERDDRLTDKLQTPLQTYALQAR